MSHLFYVFFVYEEVSLFNVNKITNAQFVGQCLLDSWPNLMHSPCEKVPFDVVIKSLLSPIAWVPHTAEGAEDVTLVKTKTNDVHFGFSHRTFFQFGPK